MAFQIHVVAVALPIDVGVAARSGSVERRIVECRFLDADRRETGHGIGDVVFCTGRVIDAVLAVASSAAFQADQLTSLG